MNTPLRVLIADDERPARSFLAAMLRTIDEVELVGEAADGPSAVTMIERLRPDLALLDLQMPELDGLGVVGMLRREAIPLIAFVTAHDEFAVQAFEANAVDYLLKPVEPRRLAETIARAQDRLERADARTDASRHVSAAADRIAAAGTHGYPRRLPVRHQEDVILVPVDQIATIQADGEVLRITTTRMERFTLTERLRDVEARLDPALFIRLSRSLIANLEMVQRVSPVAGGLLQLTLSNGMRLGVSRLRARALREQLTRI